MPFDADVTTGFSANDRALIEEAVRRIRSSRDGRGSDLRTVHTAVATAFRQGRRDLFGLVKMGSQIRG